MRYKVMLPENYVIIEADTEEEAIDAALKRFVTGIQADDLIAWEDKPDDRNAYDGSAQR